jgi:NADH-quinone oxidoreductase subunit L
MISVAMTAIYMFRMYFLVFFGSFRGTQDQANHLHESPISMTLPLIVLAVLSIVGGVLNLPGIFLHKGTHWLSHYLEHNTRGLELIHTEHLSSSQALILMTVAVAMTLVILILSYIVYVKKETTAKEDSQLSGWEKLSANKLYWDEAYNFLFVRPVTWLSDKIYAWIEIPVIYGSVMGIAKGIGRTGDLVRKWQSGVVSSYLLWMVTGVIGLVVYYLVKK